MAGRSFIRPATTVFAKSIYRRETQRPCGRNLKTMSAQAFGIGWRLRKMLLGMRAMHSKDWMPRSFFVGATHFISRAQRKISFQKFTAPTKYCCKRRRILVLMDFVFTKMSQAGNFSAQNSERVRRQVVE